ncbi:GntR family transcriptional regulator [Streptomyces sp. NPDC002644]
MIEWDESEPRWVQVAAVIRRQIESGELPPGSRVPSVVQIIETYGISNVTAQKVLRGLREEGLIKTQPGMGSFVK